MNGGTEEGLSSGCTGSDARAGWALHNNSDTDASAPRNPPRGAWDSQSPASASVWPLAEAAPAAASKALVVGTAVPPAWAAASSSLTAAAAALEKLAVAAVELAPAVPRH